MSFPEKMLFGPGREVVHRMALPYGVWTCLDREVLFNRHYQPIWQRPLTGPGIPLEGICMATQANPSEWVKWRSQQWFWDDASMPWEDAKRLRRCYRILELNAWSADQDGEEPKSKWYSP